MVRFASSRPVSILMIYLGLVLFGLAGAARLPVEIFPRLSIPVLRVVSEMPGIPAAELEELVTLPLENALSSVQGVKGIDALTSDGLSAVVLRFDWTVGLPTAVIDVREAVDAVYPFLPAGSSRPAVLAEDLSDEPLAILAVRPKGGKTLLDLERTIRRDLTTRLRQVPGIASIRIVGCPTREILVDVDPGRLYAAGLPVTAVRDAVSSSVFDLPAGTVTQGGVERLVKTSTGVRDLSRLAELPIGGLKLRDLAGLREGAAEATSFFHVNGEAAVGIIVTKTPEAGTTAAAAALRRELPALESIYRGTLSLELLFDGSGPVDAAFSNLASSLGIGAAAAVLVLVLLFRDLVLSVIVALSLPASFSGAALAMYLSGFSLNLVSLSGLALGLGMVVDASVVVLENLVRRGARSEAEIASATVEMGGAIAGSTATTLLVFVPVVFVPGVIGALFTELALSIAFLLLASLAAAVTLTPALYRLLIAGSIRLPALPRIPRCVVRGYAAWLSSAFRRPMLAVGLAVLIVAASALSFVRLPKEVLPPLDSGLLFARLELPAGTGLESTAERARRLAGAVLKLEGVRKVYVEAGYDRQSLAERSRGGRGVHILEAGLLYRPGAFGHPRSAAARVEETLRREDGLASIRVTAAEDPLVRVVGSGSALRLRFRDEDRSRAEARAKAAAAEAVAMGVAASVQGPELPDRPTLAFSLDPRLAAGVGVTAAETLSSLAVSVRGEVAARMRKPEGGTDIRVRINPAALADPSNLNRLRVAGAGGLVELSTVGTFHAGTSYQELHRSSRQASVGLGLTQAFGPEGPERLAVFVGDWESRGAELAGRSAFESSSRDVLVVFAAAAVLMYLLLGAQFESPVLPLALLLSLPLSAAGSLLALLLAGRSLNLNSVLGILILFGTTINTSILLSSAFGRGRAATIIRSSVARLLPVAATVATTVFALIPTALNLAPEAAAQSDTALALAGGLLFGTVVILAIHPVVHHLVTRGR